MARDALLLEALPEHNEAIAGDSLFSIQLNYKWRMIIAGLLSEYFWEDDSDISFDNQSLLTALINDLYDAETLNMQRYFNGQFFELGSGFLTTSASPVKVTGSSFNWTPTHNRMKLTCRNVVITNSQASGYTGLQVRFNALEGLGVGGALMFGTTLITVAVTDVFTVTPGVVHEVALYCWRLIAGNATVSRISHLSYEIEEWDE